MIIAGEASGDLHGAGVVRELRRRRPDIDIFGIGGDKMQREGMRLVYNVRELAVMGFWEVIQHLPLLRSVERTLGALLTMRRPDVLVLIDYPGFNLRFANLARRHHIKIVYYISPQVWAWNPGRVRKMKGLIDKMLVVFPFEKQIYEKEGIDVEFVGHPLLEELYEPQSRDAFCKRYALQREKLTVGLFPGSRKQEIERIFPVMLGAARLLHAEFDTQTVVGVAPVLDADYVKSFLRENFPIQLIFNATHDAMANSDVALVTSGTATLETACFRTPMIVVYKTSWLTYLIGRMFVRINTIGLVNIVAGRQVVPELIQYRLNPRRLASAAADLLMDKTRSREISDNLADVRQRLGTPGASVKVAETILSMAERSQGATE